MNTSDLDHGLSLFNIAIMFLLYSEAILKGGLYDVSFLFIINPATKSDNIRYHTYLLTWNTQIHYTVLSHLTVISQYTRNQATTFIIHLTYTTRIYKHMSSHK